MPYDMDNPPFRLRVQRKISAVIEAITVDNGWQSDLGEFEDEAGRPRKRVYRGRDLYGDNDPLPLVSILEDPRPMDVMDHDEAATIGSTYRLAIQGFVDDDKDNPTDAAHFLAAEIITALSAEKEDKFNILGFGDKEPCVVGMTIGSPVVRPADDEVSDVAFCFIPLKLELVENLERPFD